MKIISGMFVYTSKVRFISALPQFGCKLLFFDCSGPKYLNFTPWVKRGLFYPFDGLNTVLYHQNHQGFQFDDHQFIVTHERNPVNFPSFISKTFRFTPDQHVNDFLYPLIGLKLRKLHGKT